MLDLIRNGYYVHVFFRLISLRHWVFVEMILEQALWKRYQFKVFNLESKIYAKLCAIHSWNSLESFGRKRALLKFSNKKRRAIHHLNRLLAALTKELIVRRETLFSLCPEKDSSLEGCTFLMWSINKDITCQEFEAVVKKNCLSALHEFQSDSPPLLFSSAFDRPWSVSLLPEKEKVFRGRKTVFKRKGGGGKKRNSCRRLHVTQLRLTARISRVGL